MDFHAIKTGLYSAAGDFAELGKPAASAKVTWPTTAATAARASASAWMAMPKAVGRAI